MFFDRLFTGTAGSAGLGLLTEAVLKGTALLALAAFLALALRSGSAAQRHFVWTCALVGLVALPILLALLPAWRVSAPALAWLAPPPTAPPAADFRQGPSPASAAEDPSPVPAPSALEPRATSRIAPPARAPTMPATTAPPPGIAWRAVVLALWAIGALAVLRAVATMMTWRFSRSDFSISSATRLRRRSPGLWEPLAVRP